MHKRGTGLLIPALGSKGLHGLSPVPKGGGGKLFTWSACWREGCSGQHTGLTSPGSLPCPDHLSLALSVVWFGLVWGFLFFVFFKLSLSSFAFEIFRGRVKSDVNSVFTKVREFSLCKAMLFTKRYFVSLWVVGLGSSSTFIKRDPESTEFLGAVWQDVIHKNRKRNPSRVFLSLAITPQEGFITTNRSSSQSC